MKYFNKYLSRPVHFLLAVESLLVQYAGVYVEHNWLCW